MKTVVLAMFVKSADNITDLNGNVEIEFTAEPCDHAPDFEDENGSFAKKLANDYELNYTGVSPNWFTACVKVTHKGFESVDYLGGCSYRSYDEFVKLPNDYFADMVNTCMDSINGYIDDHNKGIKERWKFRKELKAKGLYECFLSNLKAIKSF